MSLHQGPGAPARRPLSSLLGSPRSLGHLCCWLFVTVAYHNQPAARLVQRRLWNCCPARPRPAHPGTAPVSWPVPASKAGAHRRGPLFKRHHTCKVKFPLSQEV